VYDYVGRKVVYALNGNEGDNQYENSFKDVAAL
jgi:hypothetical protein